MRKTVTVLIATLLALALLDGIVAATLSWAERNNRLGSLVRYFDYGRSVPGKLEHWAQTPGSPGNLLNVAWLSDGIAASQVNFAAETPTSEPIIRTYGMSFVNNIIVQAMALEPGLQLDNHGGPAAPPNFTYAFFEDDRANRRPGDIVVLGLLASSVPAMAAMSNSTWAFEQPAPFTYPIYWPEGDGLGRVDPVLTRADDLQNPEIRAPWYAQLAREDAFYTFRTYGGAIWMDASPFLRLLRRSAAISYIDQREARILSSDLYPETEVLQRMITAFAQTARADGQRPIVFVIQTRDPGDIDLLEATLPALQANKVPYLATAELYDPRDPSGFAPDGHYTEATDRLFGAAFLELLAR